MTPPHVITALDPRRAPPRALAHHLRCLTAWQETVGAQVTLLQAVEDRAALAPRLPPGIAVRWLAGIDTVATPDGGRAPHLAAALSAMSLAAAASSTSLAAAPSAPSLAAASAAMSLADEIDTGAPPPEAASDKVRPPRAASGGARPPGAALDHSPAGADRYSAPAAADRHTAPAAVPEDGLVLFTAPDLMPALGSVDALHRWADLAEAVALTGALCGIVEAAPFHCARPDRSGPVAVLLRPRGRAAVAAALAGGPAATATALTADSGWELLLAAAALHPSVAGRALDSGVLLRESPREPPPRAQAATADWRAEMARLTGLSAGTTEAMAAAFAARVTEATALTARMARPIRTLFYRAPSLDPARPAAAPRRSETAASREAPAPSPPEREAAQRADPGPIDPGPAEPRGEARPRTGTGRGEPPDHDPGPGPGRDPDLAPAAMPRAQPNTGKAQGTGPNTAAGPDRDAEPGALRRGRPDSAAPQRARQHTVTPQRARQDTVTTQRAGPNTVATERAHPNAVATERAHQDPSEIQRARLETRATAVAAALCAADPALVWQARRGEVTALARRALLRGDVDFARACAVLATAPDPQFRFHQGLTATLAMLLLRQATEADPPTAQRPAAKPDPKAKLETAAGPRAGPKPGSEIGPERRPETGRELGPETGPETGPGTETDRIAEAQRLGQRLLAIGAEAGAKTGPRTEPKPDPTADPGAVALSALRALHRLCRTTAERRLVAAIAAALGQSGPTGPRALPAAAPRSSGVAGAPSPTVATIAAAETATPAPALPAPKTPRRTPQTAPPRRQPAKAPAAAARARLRRVALLSRGGGGGGGIAAARLAESLAAEPEVQVDLLTAESLDMRLPPEPAPRRSMTNHTLSDTQFTIEYAGFVRDALVARLAQYDLVNVHWATHLIALGELQALAALGRPMLFSLHDFHYLTGGCHYPATCDRLAAGCTDCPQVDASRCAAQAVPVNLAIKRRMFAQPWLHIAAPSQWLRDRAVASGIVGGDRAHVLRNPYAPPPLQRAGSPSPGGPGGLGKGDLGRDDLAPGDLKPSDPERGAPEPGGWTRTPGPPRILLIAAHLGERRKGMLVALESLAALVAKGHAVRIDLVGRADAAMETAIAATAAGMPITHHGQIDDHGRLAALYAACDLVLMCSTEDNWPNVLVEAGAQGVPAVVGPGHGCAEFVHRFGQGGIARGYGAEAFADALAAQIAAPLAPADRAAYAAAVRAAHAPATIAAEFRRLAALPIAAAQRISAADPM